MARKCPSPETAASINGSRSKKGLSTKPRSTRYRTSNSKPSPAPSKSKSESKGTTGWWNASSRRKTSNASRISSPERALSSGENSGLERWFSDVAHMLSKTSNADAARPPATEKRIRLFIAINVPAALKSKLGELQQEIESSVNKGAVRWARPEQLHITLKFLGYVETSARLPIDKELQKVCEGTGRFRLEVQGAGCFPNARSPRVIWVGIAGDLTPLLELQTRIELATSTWAEPEEREFKPHLTLGRAKELRKRDVQSIGKFLQKHADAHF